jgi:hypothetical protein
MGIFSALGNLVGGFFGQKEETKRVKRQINANRDAAKTSRADYLKDRTDERNYAANLTAKDRAYAEKMLFGERDYARKITAVDRAYNERMLGKDRKYAEGVYDKQRKDMAADKVVDMTAYKKDRSEMQALADKQAIRTAASRGIDFQRLRDDATAAGFNPLTAMQWASAYNTEKGFGVMGDAYSGSSSSPGQVIPARGEGGSTVAQGAPAVGSIMPGSNGFSSSGGGYGSTSMPALSSTSFLASALGEVLDTGFNAWNHRDDEMYQSIVDQVARGQLAREYDDRTPRNFGYNLSKIEPFRPAIGVYTPPLGPSGLDPVHNRPVVAQPVSDLPMTGMYDNGVSKVRGLSQDVEWSEVAQMGNEAYLAASTFGDYMAPKINKYASGIGGIVPMTFPKIVKPKVKAGTGSYSLTGSYPYAPLMNAYGGF